MSTRVNPIRLFVTHAWVENDDYGRVFEYLEASGTFYYLNTSQPQAKRPIDKESQREDLRRQISPSEVIVVLPAVYRSADRRHGEFRFDGSVTEGHQGSGG